VLLAVLNRFRWLAMLERGARAAATRRNSPKDAFAEVSVRPASAEELLEEGIPVARLPLPPTRKLN
jgi:hypothetical protein